MPLLHWQFCLWVSFFALIAFGCKERIVEMSAKSSLESSNHLVIEPIRDCGTCERSTRKPVVEASASVCRSQLTPCLALSSVESKRWILVGFHNKENHHQLPFESLTFFANGSWLDSNEFGGAWRFNAKGDCIDFANECKTVRCEVLELDDHSLVLKLLNWAPGLIVELEAESFFPEN